MGGPSRAGGLIARSRHRARIRFVNRYVTDSEVADAFARADVAVLPTTAHLRAVPLQIAMAHGLPVVTTAVGGLIEATAGYEGAILVEPREPRALLAGIEAAAHLRSQRFAEGTHGTPGAALCRDRRSAGLDSGREAA